MEKTQHVCVCVCHTVHVGVLLSNMCVCVCVFCIFLFLSLTHTHTCRCSVCHALKELLHSSDVNHLGEVRVKWTSHLDDIKGDRGHWHDLIKQSKQPTCDFTLIDMVQCTFFHTNAMHFTQTHKTYKQTNTVIHTCAHTHTLSLTHTHTLNFKHTYRTTATATGCGCQAVSTMTCRSIFT